VAGDTFKIVCGVSGVSDHSQADGAAVPGRGGIAAAAEAVKDAAGVPEAVGCAGLFQSAVVDGFHP